MKTVTAFFLMLTTLMVTTALAAPALDMTIVDCTKSGCHDDTGVLKNDDHAKFHPIGASQDTCFSDYCHEQGVPRSLDCMRSDCHDSSTVIIEDIIPVADHHDLIIDNDCSICHEKGVPRAVK